MDNLTARQILGLGNRDKTSGISGRPVARGWKECGYTRVDLEAAAEVLGLSIRLVTGKTNNKFFVMDSQDY